MLQNVSLGQMVKTLALEWYGYTDDALAYLFKHLDEGEFDVKELKGLAAAAGTRVLNLNTVQDLEQDSGSTKAILLISSFPNLRVLSVRPPSSATLFDIRFARLATDGKSFPNLRRFERMQYGREDFFHLGLLSTAMLIPSLTTLIGFSASSDDNNDDDDLRAGTSNVTCLALEHSKITGRELSRILRIPKGLRYFSFSDGGSTLGSTPCSRKEFGRALACTSQTLEYLSIVWNKYPEAGNSTLCSLQGFKRLRVLSIEFNLLFGDDDRTRAAVDLTSVLPQTIEQLFLLRDQNGSWTEAQYLRSIERLIQAKSGSLMPALSFIGLRPEPQLLAPLLNFAATKGIEIPSRDPQKTRFSCKTFPTTWYPLSEEILG